MSNPFIVPFYTGDPALGDPAHPTMVSRVKAAGAAAAAKASAVGGAAGAAAAAAAQKAGLIKKYNSHADQKMDCITPNPYTI